VDSLINIGLYIAYAALLLAGVSLVAFPVITMVKGNFSKAKSSLLGVAGLIVVFFIAYLVSPAEQGEFYTKMNISANVSKLIGAGILTSYFIVLALVVIVVYTTVLKWFR